MTARIDPIKCVQKADTSQVTFKAGHNVGFDPDAEMPYFYLRQMNQIVDELDPATGETNRVQKKEVVYLTAEEFSRVQWKQSHVKHLIDHNNQGTVINDKPIIPMPQDKFDQAVKQPPTRKRSRTTTEGCKKKSTKAGKKTKKTANRKKRKTLTPPKPSTANTSTTDNGVIEAPERGCLDCVNDWLGYGMLLSLIRITGEDFYRKVDQCLKGEHGLDDPALVGSIFTNNFCPELKKLDLMPYVSDIPPEIELEHRGQALKCLKLGARLVMHVYAEMPWPGWTCPSLVALSKAPLDMNHAGVKFALVGKGMSSPETWTYFAELCSYPWGSGEPNKQFSACVLMGMQIGFLWHVIQ